MLFHYYHLLNQWKPIINEKKNLELIKLIDRSLVSLFSLKLNYMKKKNETKENWQHPYTLFYKRTLFLNILYYRERERKSK